VSARGQRRAGSIARNADLDRRPLRRRQPSYSATRGTARDLPRDPVIEMAGPVRDFSVQLSDCRRVIGDDHHGEWTIYVYGSDGELLGYGTAATRLHALEDAGLSDDDTGEVLGRSGI
jgi:hypothetical protein